MAAIMTPSATERASSAAAKDSGRYRIDRAAGLLLT
jgi:hypothetical protein